VLLLNHGAKGHALNSVNRTPPQMAAFVGNHNCVAAINNFVPMSDVQYYIVPNGLDMDPKLPPVLAESFHKLITQVNVHPVAVLISLQKAPALVQGHKQVRNVLSLMSEREIKRGQEANEVLSFKFHWLGMIFEDIEMTEETKTDKTKDVLDLCQKKMTKPSALDQFVRISVRRFPFIDSTLFRQIANGLASFAQDKTSEPGSSFSIIMSAVNGQRGFASNSHCSACSNENASLQCSRCKKEVYCGTDCQKVHWHMHKKSCKAPSAASKPSSEKMKDEDKANLADMVAQQLSAQTLEVK
jgi:ankyrin repeat and MYND domain-containing protein 2